MPHETLTRYLREIESALQQLTACHFEKYEEEVLSANRANIRVRVRFIQGNLLEISEAVAVEENEIRHLSYRC